MKRIALIFIFLFSSQTYAKASVRYSEAADVFEIMDHVSLWTSQISPVIRKYWEKKYGAIDGEDLDMINQYIAVRRKSDGNYSSYITEVSPQIVLFGGRGIVKVPLSSAFYSSKSVGEALKKCAPYFNTKDYKFLVSFYKHFLPKISNLVKESTSFKAHLGNHNNALKKVHNGKVLKRLGEFLGLKLTAKSGLKYLVTWWPPGETPVSDSRSNYILLRYHPQSGAKVWDGHSLLSAGVKSYMSHMTFNQKSNATKVFNRYCMGRSIEFNDALEAIWVKALPEKWSKKKKFTLQKTWEKDTFTNLYVKLLFPLIEETITSRQNIEGTFIHQSSRLCGELHQLATSPSLN